ncbi:hypothetical protein [Rummeliibacillus pycnus]|uniref:hypothetical protein n=1 Tax=Rummeliibacillus pycnus TaxID=101070 RepID=UPI0037CB78C3
MEAFLSPLKNFVIDDYEKDFEFTDKDHNVIFQIHFQSDAKKFIFEKSLGKYIENIGYINAKIIEDNYISFSPLIGLNDKERSQHIFSFSIANQFFVQALWFIKDNAVTPVFASVCSCEYNGNLEEKPVILLNQKNYFTKANGDINETHFTLEEIQQASFWYSAIVENQIKNSSKVEIELNKTINTSLYSYNETTSLSRSFMYLNTVRQETFLPAKIAMYISILETLFAVKGENTHKVAERTSIFISEKAKDSMKIYEDIKECYKFRSDYVHGSHIKHSNVKTIQEICIKLDEIVRLVMKKIIVEHPELIYVNKKKEGKLLFDDVNNKFNELVLTKHLK